MNENWLPLWLGEAGYNTYYTGKLFNQHTVWNYDNPYPSGFTGSDFLLDPYTYEYLNSSYQRNQDTPVSHEGEYSTDVLASKAYGFLDDAAESDKPFFLVVAPNAPHSNVALKTVLPGDPPLSPEFEFGAPVSADRHRHLFKDVKIPRTPHFNPEHVGSDSPNVQSFTDMYSHLERIGFGNCRVKTKLISITMTIFTGNGYEHCRLLMSSSMDYSEDWRSTIF